jgi:hypothetical protein
MATQQVVNVGVQANDATGDLLRDAFTKINNNFAVFFTGNFPTAQMTVGPPPSGVALTVNGIAGQNAIATTVGTVSIGAPTTGTALTITGNSSSTALLINTTLTSGQAVQVVGNVNQSLSHQMINANTGTSAASSFSCGDASNNAAFMEFQGINSTAQEVGGVAGLAVNMGSSSNIPLQICTNDTVRITLSGAGAMGFYGGSPVAKPTVSGSKGGNAALTSLMTALAALGLVTDTTT